MPVYNRLIAPIRKRNGGGSKFPWSSATARGGASFRATAMRRSIAPLNYDIVQMHVANKISSHSRTERNAGCSMEPLHNGSSAYPYRSAALLPRHSVWTQRIRIRSVHATASWMMSGFIAVGVHFQGRPISNQVFGAQGGDGAHCYKRHRKVSGIFASAFCQIDPRAGGAFPHSREGSAVNAEC